MKILLIEDDKSLSTFIKKGLRENGHIIDDFNDGSKGLEAAYLEEHDIILLDRMLPSIDGISIVKQLRKDNIFTPVLSNICIPLFTSSKAKSWGVETIIAPSTFTSCAKVS